MSRIQAEHRHVRAGGIALRKGVDNLSITRQRTRKRRSPPFLQQGQITSDNFRNATAIPGKQVGQLGSRLG